MWTPENDVSCAGLALLSVSSLHRYLSTYLDQGRLILDQIAVTALAYLLICLVLYQIAVRWYRSRFPEHHKRILIVTAHPDDECMFFGPTILSLSRRKDCQVYLLCLSRGNFDKKGHLRRGELWASCRALQMRPDNVILYNVTELQDDPTIEWKAQTVSRIIKKYVDVLGIQALITFDHEGVSRHPNHCHIYYAIASLYLGKVLKESQCRFFTLDSINVFRKYALLFDLPATLLFSTHWFVLGWRDFAVVRRAMKEHKSQLLWFRHLYILFSRYMLINSLRRIRLSDIELDLQLFE